MKRIIPIMMSMMLLVTMCVPNMPFVGEKVYAETVTAEADENADGLVYKIVNGSYAVVDAYTGTDTAIVIPEVTPDGYTVKEIDSYTFDKNVSLESVVLSQSLETIGYAAFRGCTALKTIELPQGLKVLEGHSFSGCESLEKIIFPDTVERIDSSAFSGCINLSSINYPEGIASMGSNVFANCAITKMDVPEGITSIPDYAFYGASSIEEITLPSSLNAIGNSAFYNCTGLKKAEIPDSVNELGSGVFYGCSGMTEVVLPSGLTDIPAGLFWGCTSLKAVDIPEGVVTIGSSAFHNCDSVTEFTLPDEVYEIGSSAFRSCDSLTEINYPLGLETAGSAAFGYCDNLQSINVPEGIVKLPDNVFSFIRAKEIVLPETLTCIGNNAFERSSIEKIDIPEGVTDIGDKAFTYCTSLIQVELPETLTAIGQEAFCGCSALKNIVLPDSLTTLEKWAFRECTSLEKINYPKSLASVKGAVFEDCTALETVMIPEGVKSIVNESFSSADGIKNVEFPATLETIGKRAFYDCDGLAGLDLPSGLKTIGDSAFGACDSLVSVEIPDSVTELGASSFGSCTQLEKINYPQNLQKASAYFSGCPKITSFTVPDGVKVLPANVFRGCSYLTEINLPDGLEVIDEGALYSCKGLTDVVIPGTVKEIGKEAFRNCIGLKGIRLPESVQTIGENAFSGCSGMTEIIIPGSVTSAGSSAFSDCTAVTDIKIGEGVTELSSYCFSGCVKLKNISLPSTMTTLSKYMFKDCAGIIEVELPEGVTTILEGAFQGCINLSVWNYPVNIKTTSPNIFRGCESLTYINIPEGITAVPDNSFKDAENLQEVVLPSTMTKIGKSAFSSCETLKKIWIDEGVTEIGENAFLSCSNLTIYGKAGSYAETYAAENNIPFSAIKFDVYNGGAVTGYVKDAEGNGIENVRVSVYSHDDGAVYETVSTGADGKWTITKVNEGSRYTVYLHHPDYTFENTCAEFTAEAEEMLVDTVIASVDADLAAAESAAEDFKYTEINTYYAVINSYKGTDTAVKVPETINGLKVIQIGAKAFSGNTTIEKVALPATVKEIHDSAFEGCSSLTRVALPGTLNYIGSKAFSGCAELSGVVLPDTISRIDLLAFQSCKKITAINYPRGLEKTEGDVFHLCTGLQSVVIPEGVEYIASGIFSGSSVAAAELPSTLKSVGSAAFSDSDLKQITIHEGVSKIAGDAFNGCDKLTSVSLPQSLKIIGAEAFKGCDALKAICLPDAVESLGTSAFEGCTALTDINFPASLTDAGNYIFKDCTALKVFNVPEGVTVIPAHMFYGCNELRYVTLPQTAVKIGDYAFYNCEQLESVYVGAEVAEIGTYSFSECEQLTIYGETGSYAETYAGEKSIPFSAEEMPPVERVTITGVVKDTEGNPLEGVSVSLTDAKYNRIAEVKTDENGIWEYTEAFKGVDYRIRYYHPAYKFAEALNAVNSGEEGISLENSTAEAVDVPDSVGDVFEYSVSSEKVSVTKYKGNAGVVIVPEEIEGYPVTSIAKEAFSENADITEIVLPNGLKYIGEKAFYNCTGLSKMYIPDSVDTIYSQAFDGCSGLTEMNYPTGLSYTASGLIYGTAVKQIVIPEGITEIVSGSFKRCASLEHVEFPESLKVIGDSAFYGCTALKEVELPAYLYNIRGRAFKDCTSISKITLPETLAQLGSECFSGCTALAEVNYPEGIKSCEGDCFKGCISLKEITVPDGIKNIPENIFSGGSFEIIRLPDSLERIPKKAFKDCAALTEIIIPEGVSEIDDYAFYGCAGLKTVEVPEKVKRVGYWSFRKCSSLESLSLPEGLEEIYDGAFAGTGISAIEFPAGLKVLRSDAFSDCYNLQEVYFPAGIETVRNSIFEGCKNLRKAVFEEGVTNIPDLCFANCISLEEVHLPSTLLYIGSAFWGCTALEGLMIPAGVTGISINAFVECPDITLYGDAYSYAAKAAVEEGWKFKAISAEGSTVAIDRTSSQYYVDDQMLSSRGTVEFVMDYKVKEEKLENLSSLELTFYIPEGIEVDCNSIRINNKLIEASQYNLSGERLVIDTAITDGRVTFSAVPEKNSLQIKSYAQVTAVSGRDKYTDIVDVINQDISVMTINTDDYVGDGYFTVAGFAPALQYVEIYVDDQMQSRVRSTKAGIYTARIKLEAPRDCAEYVITAKTADAGGQESSASKKVIYKQGHAEVTEFSVKYDGRAYDLLKEKPVLVHNENVSEQMKFTVRFENADLVGSVYIISERGSVEKTVKAEWDPVSEAFVAYGNFDGDNKGYVPGNLRVEYRMKTGAYKVQDLIAAAEDKADVSFAARLNDYVTADSQKEISITSGDETAVNDITQYMKTVAERWTSEYSFNAADAAGNLYTMYYGLAENGDIELVIYDAAASTAVTFSMKSSDEQDIVLLADELKNQTLPWLQKTGIAFDYDQLKEAVMYSADMAPEEAEINRKTFERLNFTNQCFTLMTWFAANGELGQLHTPALLYGMLYEGVINDLDFFADKQFVSMESKIPSYNIAWKIDPSGCVFDEATGQPLEGVTVTAYWIEEDTGDPDFWNNKPDKSEKGELWDASEWGQLNPLITDSSGEYSWDVPSGWWRVEYRKDCYQTVSSEWMAVPPVQTDVNAVMKKEHDFGEWTVIEQATCTSTGEKYRKCMYCDVSETQQIEALDHNYSDKYTVDKPASFTENGSKSRYCLRCGSKTSVTEIPELESVKLSAGKYLYDGYAKKPSVTVKDLSGNIVAAEHYTVSYASGRTKPGRYKVKVTLKGDYEGSEELLFTVVPKKPSSATANLSTTTTPSSSRYDDVTFSWKTCTGASGYLVYCKKGSGSWSKAVATTKTSYTKKNLSDGVKYTFKVIPYYKSGTTKYYSTAQYRTATVYTLKKLAAPSAAKSGTKVRAKWKNISGETGYQISRSTTKTGTKIVATYKTTSGTSKLISAAKGKTYYYKVRAYKKIGTKTVYGPWSSVKAYRR